MSNTETTPLSRNDKIFAIIMTILSLAVYILGSMYSPVPFDDIITFGWPLIGAGIYLYCIHKDSDDIILKQTDDWTMGLWLGLIAALCWPLVFAVYIRHWYNKD